MVNLKSVSLLFPDGKFLSVRMPLTTLITLSAVRITAVALAE